MRGSGWLEEPDWSESLRFKNNNRDLPEEKLRICSNDITCCEMGFLSSQLRGRDSGPPCHAMMTLHDPHPVMIHVPLTSRTCDLGLLQRQGQAQERPQLRALKWSLYFRTRHPGHSSTVTLIHAALPHTDTDTGPPRLPVPTCESAAPYVVRGREISILAPMWPLHFTW